MLAVALLLCNHGYEYVFRVNAKDVPERLDDTDIVIDVGRVYDEDKRLDHHQDPKLPCALHLVVKHKLPHLSEALNEIFWYKMVDIMDRFGPKGVETLTGVTDGDVMMKAFYNPFTNHVQHLFEQATIIRHTDPLFSILHDIGNTIVNGIMITQQAFELVVATGTFVTITIHDGPRDIVSEGIVCLDSIPGFNAAMARLRKTLPQLQWNASKSQRGMTLYRFEDASKVIDFNNCSDAVKGKFSFVHNSGFIASLYPGDYTIEELAGYVADAFIYTSYGPVWSEGVPEYEIKFGGIPYGEK